MRNGDHPAYPTETDGHHFEGLTKRELFAIKAMQGIFASPLRDDATSEMVAQWSVYAADALLEELAKEEQ